MSERVKIVRFRPEHLEALRERRLSARSTGDLEWRELTRYMLEEYGGGGLSLISGGRVLAVGLVMRSPFDTCDGVACMHTADGFERHALSWTRAARRHIARLASEMGLRRVFASVLEDWASARRWIRLLGFEEAKGLGVDLQPGQRVYVRVSHGIS